MSEQCLAVPELEEFFSATKTPVLIRDTIHLGLTHAVRHTLASIPCPGGRCEPRAPDPAPSPPRGQTASWTTSGDKYRKSRDSSRGSSREPGLSRAPTPASPSRTEKVVCEGEPVQAVIEGVPRRISGCGDRSRHRWTGGLSSTARLIRSWTTRGISPGSRRRRIPGSSLRKKSIWSRSIFPWARVINGRHGLLSRPRAGLSRSPERTRRRLRPQARPGHGRGRHRHRSFRVERRVVFRRRPGHC